MTPWQPCSDARAEKIWDIAGSYSVVLSVRDKDGGLTRATRTITVKRHPSSTVLRTIESTSSNGEVVLSAELRDELDPTSLPVGRLVAFRRDADPDIASPTDTAGVARANVLFQRDVANAVTATFSGDTQYQPSSDMVVFAPSDFSSRPEPLGPPPSADNRGLEFILGFTENDFTVDKDLFLLLSAERATSAEISAPGIDFKRQVNVVPGSITTIPIPGLVQMKAIRDVEKKGILIRAEDDITVRAISERLWSTDGYLAIPTDALGTDYIATGWAHRSHWGSALGVIATEDRTRVTVTTTADAEPDPDTGAWILSGSTVTRTLNRLETFSLRSPNGDLTGTLVSADKPIVLISGHECANVPVPVDWCDHMTSQPPPISSWGRRYVSVPFARRAADLVRIIASRNGTRVTVNGAAVATLDRGEFHELDLLGTSQLDVESDAPVLVVQYAKSTENDLHGDGDPLLLPLVPSEQFASEYIIAPPPEVDTIDGEPTDDRRTWENWVNLIAPTTQVGGLRLDGEPITAAWMPIGTSGYSGAQVAVTNDEHTILHLSPVVTFGAYAYGWARQESYGYAAGRRLAPIAEPCTPTNVVAGDALDNDCDGRIDEELGDGNDDDGDGLIDEDTVPGAPGTNVAPVAIDLTLEVVEDTTRSLVLSAYDLNGDSILYEVVDAPENGTLAAYDPASVAPVPLGALTDLGPLLAYVPNPEFSGADSFRFRASDGTLHSQLATVTINVAPVADRPRITSQPPFQVNEDIPYTYQITVADGDVTGTGETFTFFLDAGPAGMTLDADTGRLDWTPGDDGVGEQTTTVRVEDSTGLFDTQTFTLYVGNQNDTPVIPDAPTPHAIPGELFRHVVEVVDPDPWELLSFTLLESPEGMVIGGVDGVIEWLPTAAQAGTHVVTVRVQDALRATATRTFTVEVEPDELPPVVAVEANPIVLYPGQTTRVTVVASDNARVASVELTVDGFAVPLDLSGQATVVAGAPGVSEIVATATDGAANSATATTIIGVRDPSDTTSPSVSLSSPSDGAVVTFPENVVGSVSDDNLVLYSVSIAESGTDAFREIATGRESVTDGVLGALDPTLLRNGLYRVRLEGLDVNGRQSADEVTVQVEGNAKIGAFQLAFNDLAVPLVGIPLVVSRSYDSRVKSGGQLGIGWSLDLFDVSITHNRLPGQGWQFLRSPVGIASVPFPCQRIQELARHITEVRFSDTEFYEFRIVLEHPGFAFFGCSAIPRFEFVDGSTPGATLELLDVQQVQASSLEGTDFVFDPDGGSQFRPFVPHRLRLTTRDGRIFDFLDEKLTRIADADGNEVQVSPSGLVHSSGEGIEFALDARGRIERIRAPSGAELLYEYDDAGDLVASTDPEGNRSRYVYDADHNLVEIHDPLGNRATRNEYNDEGRIVAAVDAFGNRTDLEHDFEGRREIVRDRIGNVTVFEYDERGNVTSNIDALGNTTSFTYDANGDVLTTTDPLGNVSSNSFDTNGNLLTQTDPLGNTISYAYDASGRLLSTTDPAGFSVTNTYDARGNLLSRTDSLGATVSFTYDANGNLTSVTDPLGGVVTNEFDTNGNVTRQTDQSGNVSTFTYDANGNQLTQKFTRTDAGGNAVPVSVVNTFDANGRLVGGTDPNGDSIAAEFDPNGKLTMLRDRTGREMRHEYDARGQRVHTVYPDGTSESSTYDANGNRLTSTDRLGRTTSYEYDAMNRLVETMHADGTTERVEYDAIGRVIASIDALGSRTEFVYDAAGRRTRIIDVFGNETVFTYDSRGNRTGITDANGNTRTFEYDGNSRVTRIVFADGASSSVGYDALGRRTSVTDPGGNTTRYEYDASGHVVKVTDALGGEMSLAYDELGNRTAATDANGNVTGWEYDNLQSIVRRTLPLGMSETFTYDANRNLSSRTDFNGSTTTFTYDSTGQLAAKTFPDGSQVTYAYASDGRRETVTDARGDTVYAYDSMNRLVQVTEPNGATIRYSYDSQGNRVSVETASGTTLYAHDALNRLVSTTNADGGVTTYTYDAAGNRTDCAFPNGTTAEYTYDRNNRLTRVRNLRADSSVISSHEYLLGPAGERLSVTDDSGRRVEYTHDALYRLVREQITDPALGDETLTYTYDAVGNRLGMTSSRGASTYTYDANDRLLTAGSATYAYDLNGNATSITDVTGVTNFVYDYEDRLIRASSAASMSEYGYDADGVRMSSVVDGTTTEFLVDRSVPFSRVLEEREVNGDLRARYEYGNELLSQWRGGIPSYYHRDGLGSIRALTDAAGAETDSYTYDAFGVALGSTGATSNNYRFAGEELDGSTGLYYLRARYYDPAGGRFMTRDVIEGNTTDPRTFHKYLYCQNNPVNCIDPSGRTTLINLGISTAIVGILSSLAVQSYTTAQVFSTLPRNAFDGTIAPDAGMIGLTGSVSPSAILAKSRLRNNALLEGIALGLAFVSGVGGVEALFPGGEAWIYTYWGLSFSASFGQLADVLWGDAAIGSVSIYGGAVWNVATPQSYAGSFISFTGDRAIRKFPSLPLNGTAFTSPSSPREAYGYSAGVSFSVGGGAFAGSSGGSISAARTWYYLAKRIGGSSYAVPLSADPQSMWNHMATVIPFFLGFGP